MVTGVLKDGEEGGEEERERKVLGADGWTQGLEGGTRGPCGPKK